MIKKIPKNIVQNFDFQW